MAFVIEGPDDLKKELDFDHIMDDIVKSEQKKVHVPTKDEEMNLDTIRRYLRDSSSCIVYRKRK